MPVPTADKLEWYYPLKALTADGQASPQRACQAGSSDGELVNSALTEADDAWNGAIGRFDSDTPTVALRGVYFHVMDFVAATDKLVLSRPLPTAPATGGSPDTFRLFMGGKWRSSEPIPALDVAGLSNITGVVVNRAGYLNGAGDGTLSYLDATQELTWQAPGDTAPGVAVDVSIDGTYTLFSDNEDKWLIVTVDSSELPAGDEADTLTLTQPEREVLPDWEGYETDGAGKTRYHLAVVKNAAGDDMIDARVHVRADTLGTPTTLTDGIGTGAASGAVGDAGDWPLRSFWVYNSDKDDLRYVKYRSGNTLYYAAPGAGLRGKASQAWDADDAVEVYPEIDIGLDAPSTNEFENPANESTAPGGVTFAAPTSYADGLAIGTLADGAIYGIWIREVVVKGHRSREDYTNRVTVEWR
ncbi:MAG: hypothetical protein AMXMBFR7_32840 [Planctomycetota bacterium]